MRTEQSPTLMQKDQLKPTRTTVDLKKESSKNKTTSHDRTKPVKLHRKKYELQKIPSIYRLPKRTNDLEQFLSRDVKQSPYYDGQSRNLKKSLVQLESVYKAIQTVAISKSRRILPDMQPYINSCQQQKTLHSTSLSLIRRS